MLRDSTVLVSAAVLTWVMLLTASVLRTKSWTPQGLALGFGNRDALPPPTPLAGRADRAAKNTLENLVLFVAVLVAARFVDAPAVPVALGANVFLFARLAYFPLYLAGIRYLRTLAWGIGVVGLGLIAAAAF